MRRRGSIVDSGKDISISTVKADARYARYNPSLHRTGDLSSVPLVLNKPERTKATVSMKRRLMALIRILILIAVMATLLIWSFATLGASSPVRTARAQTSPIWTQLPGPSGGPVTGISISRADPNYVYLGTSTAGFFYSRDGGNSWHEGASWLHHAGSVFSSPFYPELVVELGHGSQISRDGGVSWEDLQLPSGPVFDLLFDPFNKSAMYIGYERGVLVSGDLGKSWNLNDLGAQVWHLAADPSKPGRLIAGLFPTAIEESIDWGRHWSTLVDASSLPQNFIFGLVINPIRTEEFYFLVNGFGAYKYSGGNLQQINDGLPRVPVFPSCCNSMAITQDGKRVFVVAADFENQVLGEYQLYEYDTSTNMWNLIPTPEPGQVRSVATSPSDANVVYLGTDYWPYVSSDGGLTWEIKPKGFIDNFPTEVSLDPNNPNIMYTGTVCSIGIARSSDGGQTWQWKRGGDDLALPGDWNEHYSMHIEPSNGDMVYATSAAGLAISEDRGQTWHLLVNNFSGTPARYDPSKTDHLHGLGVDPQNQNVVYVGTGRGGAGSPQDAFNGTYLWKSTDGGITWREIINGFPSKADSTVQEILVDPKNESIVYVATNAMDYVAVSPGVSLGIYKSVTGGDTWFPINNGLADLGIRDIDIDANDHNTLYAATLSGVFKTTNGGQNWSPILKQPALALVAHPKISGFLFVATGYVNDYLQVLFTLDGGASWHSANLSLARTPEGELDSHAMAIDSSGSTVYIAVMGHGLLRASVGDILYNYLQASQTTTMTTTTTLTSPTGTTRTLTTTILSNTTQSLTFTVISTSTIVSKSIVTVTSLATTTQVTPSVTLEESIAVGAAVALVFTGILLAWRHKREP